MNNELLLLISNSITGIVGWFVGRKKQQIESDNMILRNMEIVITSYKELIDDLKSEIQSLNVKVGELERKVDELHQENKRLRANL